MRAEATRALLTGATGFVGSRVAAGLLAEGWEVHAVVRPDSALERLGAAGDSVHAHRFDGTTEALSEIVGASRPDVVLHIASLFLAQHRPQDVLPLVESNVAFGTQVLEAMDLHGVSAFVNTGTSWQHYGDGDREPVNLYAATKQAFEAVMGYYVAARGLRAVTLTLFDTYGPGDPRSKLLSLLLSTLRSGEKLAMSPGEQRLDLVHVDDVAAAFEIAARRVRDGSEPGHERFAVSSGRAHSIREIVELLGIAAGAPLEVEWGGRPYRPREVMEPWHGGRPLPGWQPRIRLEDGLAALVRGD